MKLYDFATERIAVLMEIDNLSDAEYTELELLVGTIAFYDDEEEF